MATTSSVSRRIASCLKEVEVKNYEEALIHFFPALDKTAKRRRPKARVGDRIKQFISDQEIIISTIAVGGNFTGNIINGITFPEAIYKFGRTSIAHEGELDERLQITDTNELRIGHVWSLPASYIYAMCIAVMVAPENAGEQLPGSGFVTLFGEKWEANSLWGAESKLKAKIAVVFKKPDLFSQ